MSMRATTVSVLVLSALLSTSPVLAENVDCGNNESLQVAIDGLYTAGFGEITVTGTCAESITIEGFRDLTIKGNGAIIQPGTGNDGLAVGVGSNVKLCGLTIDGGRTGIVVAGSQVDSMGSCPTPGLTVQHAETGIAILEHGAFQSRNGVPLTVANNTGQGIFVTSGSRLNLQGYDGVGVDNLATVHHNGSNGVYVGEGSTALLFHANVQNNGGAGVVGTLGSVVHLAYSNVQSNGGWGVLLSNNVTGQIDGGASAPSTVTDNGGGGVLVTQRSALRLRNAPVVSGNIGSNLTCSVGGDAYGDASMIPNAKKDCKSLAEVTAPGN